MCVYQFRHLGAELMIAHCSQLQPRLPLLWGRTIRIRFLLVNTSGKINLIVSVVLTKIDDSRFNRRMVIIFYANKVNSL